MENALHLAIMLEDGTSLHMVDFILQNTNWWVGLTLFNILQLIV